MLYNITMTKNEIRPEYFTVENVHDVLSCDEVTVEQIRLDHHKKIPNEFIDELTVRYGYRPEVALDMLQHYADEEDYKEIDRLSFDGSPFTVDWVHENFFTHYKQEYTN